MNSIHSSTSGYWLSHGTLDFPSLLPSRTAREGIGTQGFVAPEIIKCELNHDMWRKMDVFAFGCLALELLSGDILIRLSFFGFIIQSCIMHHSHRHRSTTVESLERSFFES